MRKILLCLALAATLTACSSLKIFYNLAGELIHREIAFFLDLDEEGEALAERVVEGLIQWHRTRMLPLYATYLCGLAGLAEEKTPKRSSVAAFMEQGRRLWAQTVKGATPHAGRLLVQHTTPGRRQFLRNRLAKRQEERRADHAGAADERAAKRVERITRNFERFIGDLNDGQIEIIRRYVVASPGDPERRLANHDLRNKAFVDFLGGTPKAQAIADYLNRLVLTPYKITDPAYEKFSRARFARLEALLADILLSLTPKQRSAASQNLRDHAQDFNELAS